MTAPSSPEEAASQLGPPTTFWSPHLEGDDTPGLGIWDSHWQVWRVLTVGDAIGTQAPGDAVSLVPETGPSNGGAPPKPDKVAGLHAVLVHEQLFGVLKAMMARRGWALGEMGSAESAEKTFVIIPSETVDGG